MAKHTPGPWKVLEGLQRDHMNGTANVTVFKQHRGERRDRLSVVAEVWDRDLVAMGGDVIANARLIAAAPDLLEALHDLSQTFDAMCALAKSSGPNFDALRAKVRAALARAEGR